MKIYFIGMLGGFSVVGLFLILAFFIYPFNYHFSVIKDNSYIINTSKADSIVKFSEKAKIIKELERDNIILTPQEYTNNILSYYNSFLTILIAMIVIFSFVSYFHFRFLSKEEIASVFEAKIESGEFGKVLTTAIYGKVEEQFLSIETYSEGNSKLDDKLEEISSRINDLENSKFSEEIIEKG